MKLNSVIYQFRNLRTVLNINQLINLYYAEVESRLRYGICFWGLSTMSSNVFIAQKKILRVMFHLSSFVSCKDVFINYQILTVPSLLIYELCIYIHNNQDKFIKHDNIHTINTRQKNNFYVPYCRLNVTCSSPNYVGLKIYNRLPSELKLCPSTGLFKKRLKQHLICKCFYDLKEYFTPECLLW